MVATDRQLPMSHSRHEASVVKRQPRFDAGAGLRIGEWISDPRWVIEPEDEFVLRQVGDTIKLGMRVLSEHDRYRTDDDVIVQFLDESGDPFCTRGRVLGWIKVRGLLYVETHSGMAIWIDPDDTIDGQPVILSHRSSNAIKLDVAHGRVMQRLERFHAERRDPELHDIITRSFGRCMTWFAYWQLGKRTMVAPAILVAYSFPSVKGSLIRGYAEAAESISKADGVKARIAMERLYGYRHPRIKSEGPWHTLGNKAVEQTADTFGLKLRRDYRVMMANFRLA